MIKAEYYRGINGSQLLLEAEEGWESEEDSYEMLRYNSISPFLPVEKQQTGSRIQFSYDVTGKLSLEQVLELKEADSKLLYHIFRSVDLACGQAFHYMLSENDILLDKRFIFVSGGKDKVYYCYMPGWNRQLRQQFVEFMEYLLPHADHQDAQAVKLAYNVYQRVAEDAEALHTVLEDSIREGSSPNPMFAQGNPSENTMQAPNSMFAKKNQLEDIMQAPNPMFVQGDQPENTMQARNPMFVQGNQSENTMQARNPMFVQGNQSENAMQAPNPMLAQGNQSGDVIQAPNPMLARGNQLGDVIQAPNPMLAQGNQQENTTQAPNPVLAQGNQAENTMQAPNPMLAQGNQLENGVQSPNPMLAQGNQLGDVMQAPNPMLAQGNQLENGMQPPNPMFVKENQSEYAMQSPNSMFAQGNQLENGMQSPNPIYKVTTHAANSTIENETVGAMGNPTTPHRHAAVTFEKNNTQRQLANIAPKNKRNKAAVNLRKEKKQTTDIPSLETKPSAEMPVAVKKKKTGGFKELIRKKLFTDTYEPMEEPVYEEAEQEEEYQNPTICLVSENKKSGNYFIYQGMDRSRDFQCTKPQLLLGSNQNEVDICLPFPMISRIHAKIGMQLEGTYIEDLNSTNGTTVNGELLQYREKRYLQSGDVISLAGECYSFH